MDLARFRSNFTAYTDAMIGLKSISGLDGLKIPKIIVCGLDSLKSEKVVQNLIGFHSTLRNTSNIVEYRLRHDPGKLEPVASINNVPIEYDAMSKSSVLFDEILTLADWYMEPHSDPIVITIRSNNVPDIDLVEIPSGAGDDSVLKREDPDNIFVLDKNHRSQIPQDARVVRVYKDDLCPSCISEIRYYLKRSIDWMKLNETRKKLKARFAELGVPFIIGETDEQKGRLFTYLIETFRDILNAELSDRKGDAMNMNVVAVEKLWIGYKPSNLVAPDWIRVCEKVVKHVFWRFPTIYQHVQKVSNALANECHEICATMLARVETYVNQSHFVLLHMFECPRQRCSYSCTNQILVKVLTGGVLKKLATVLVSKISRIIKKEFENLDPFLSDLAESPEVTEERIRVKRELKIINQMYVSRG